MGKTASGAVWLDPNKTTPFDFYQYWRNVGDADVLKCIRMLTFLPLEQIDEMDKWEGSQLNQAKEILAYELTKLVHGEAEADKAQEAARALFGGSGSSDNMPATQLPEARFTDGKIGVIEPAGGLRPVRLQRRSPPPDPAGRRGRQRPEGGVHRCDLRPGRSSPVTAWSSRRARRSSTEPIPPDADEKAVNSFKSAAVRKNSGTQRVEKVFSPR